jgi:hypothetical protein
MSALVNNVTISTKAYPLTIYHESAEISTWT